jgi:hypothetical protein
MIRRSARSQSALAGQLPLEIKSLALHGRMAKRMPLFPEQLLKRLNVVTTTSVCRYTRTLILVRVEATHWFFIAHLSREVSLVTV